MGCSSSHRKAGQAAAHDSLPAPDVASCVEEAWATKSDAAQASTATSNVATAQGVSGDVLQDVEDSAVEKIVAGELPSGASSPHTHTGPAREDKADPDEISGSAANAQEAPSCPEQPLLPKQQQEEAAKLAGMRKRFDNQRYQQAHQAEPLAGDVPAAPQATAIGLAKEDGRSAANPTIIGIALTNAILAENQPYSAFLPGGIFDDDLQLHMPQTSKTQDTILKNFDDDEEALMQEILCDIECA